MAKEMDKGTFLGRVILDIWDNALPDVDFKPEKKMLDFFTWKHITIMKTGITRAMKNYITEELRMEKERERCEKNGPLSEPTPIPTIAEIEPEKLEAFVEESEEILRPPKSTADEKREAGNQKRIADLEKVKLEKREKISVEMKQAYKDAQTKPDKDVDGMEAPDLEKIRAAKGHIPEGLDDIDSSSMRLDAHKRLKKQDGGQAEVYVEPVVNDKDNVKLGIDLPSQPQKVSKYANSPA